MSTQLTPAQEKLHNELQDIFNDMKRVIFTERSRANEAPGLLKKASSIAQDLHDSLEASGNPPKHSSHMINARKGQSNQEKFYDNYHAIEDLLKIIDDSDAFKEPDDITLNKPFTLKVYTRRHRHFDDYNLTRTKSGWDISHMSIDGPCDKTGDPYLFKNFHQDSVQYPESIGDALQWLWDQAATEGLTVEELQAELDLLSKWLETIEKSVPTSKVWNEFF